MHNNDKLNSNTITIRNRSAHQRERVYRSPCDEQTDHFFINYYTQRIELVSFKGAGGGFGGRGGGRRRDGGGRRTYVHRDLLSYKVL